jgi:hypothetical protein
VSEHQLPEAKVPSRFSVVHLEQRFGAVVVQKVTVEIYLATMIQPLDLLGA